jgi:Uma2 family endonuclease
MLNVNLPSNNRPSLTSASKYVSWDEFHDAWDSEHRTEWVDGVLIEVSPENIRHLFVGVLLFDLVRHAVRQTNCGIVLHANFIMRLRSRPSGRMPDIMFVATEHLDRVKDTYLDGPADLAIEVISPQSVKRDRQEKLAEYEQAGIPEYWIVDEAQKEALFYVLGADGKYRPVAPAEDGIFTSRILPGLRVRLSWLWQWPLPELEDALADLPA